MTDKKEKKINKIKDQLARLRASLNASTDKQPSSPKMPKLKKIKSEIKQAEIKKIKVIKVKSNPKGAKENHAGNPPLGSSSYGHNSLDSHVQSFYDWIV